MKGDNPFYLAEGPFSTIDRWKSAKNYKDKAFERGKNLDKQKAQEALDALGKMKKDIQDYLESLDGSDFTGGLEEALNGIEDGIDTLESSMTSRGLLSADDEEEDV